MADASSKKDLGITCVNCGQISFGPNRDLDNWQCGYCYSGFISMKMLNNLVPREVLGQFNQKYRPKPGQNARPCPNCDKKMEFRSASLLSGKRVEVEMCDPCRILWFDSGDLLRTLRARRNEEISKEDVISSNNDRMTDRAIRAEGVHQWATPDFFPKQTVAFLVVSALALAAALRYPEIKTFLGLSPARPFHLFGATWLSSFFFCNHDWDFLSTGLWFLFIGLYTEQKLGASSFLRLFVTAGLIARLQYLVGGTHRDPIFYGLKPSLLALSAYAACVYPWRQVFFPAVNKWRSPREKVTNVFVTCFVACLFLVSLEFILEAIHQFGNASNGSDLLEKTLANSFAGRANQYFADNLFRTHAVGFVTGLLWYIGDTISTPSLRGENRRGNPI